MKTHVHTHPLATLIPDPNDRTVNDPAVLVEAKYIRAFYENEQTAAFMGAASNDAMFNHYESMAVTKGWLVQRIGNGALLSVKVHLDAIV